MLDGLPYEYKRLPQNLHNPTFSSKVVIEFHHLAMLVVCWTVAIFAACVFREKVTNI
jgi:hypothetical protein